LTAVNGALRKRARVAVKAATRNRPRVAFGKAR
jgi:hypothetical protein